LGLRRPRRQQPPKKQQRNTKKGRPRIEPITVYVFESAQGTSSASFVFLIGCDDSAFRPPMPASSSACHHPRIPILFLWRGSQCEACEYLFAKCRHCDRNACSWSLRPGTKAPTNTNQSGRLRRASNIATSAGSTAKPPSREKKKITGKPNIWIRRGRPAAFSKSAMAASLRNPIFDSEQGRVHRLSGSPAVIQIIVWAGNGESFIRSHIYGGHGIYKSPDGRQDLVLDWVWKSGRLAASEDRHGQSRHRSGMRVGHAYGPQPERGVSFRPRRVENLEQSALRRLKTRAARTRPWIPNNPNSSVPGCGRSKSQPGAAPAACREVVIQIQDGRRVPGSGLEGHGLAAFSVGRLSAVRVARKKKQKGFQSRVTGKGNEKRATA